jgi:hypothetical protein
MRTDWLVLQSKGNICSSHSEYAAAERERSILIYHFDNLLTTPNVVTNPRFHCSHCRYDPQSVVDSGAGGWTRTDTTLRVRSDMGGAPEMVEGRVKIENRTLFPMEAGRPQGGIISRTLAKLPARFISQPP